MYLMKRNLHNILILKRVNFFLIDILQVSVRVVKIKMLMEIGEVCGKTLSPMDLKNPKSLLSGNKPELKNTKNWYLPMDKLQKKIDKYIANHPEWKHNVLGQCKSWLKEGLKPRAMTRDLDWGVKVPLKDSEGKVLYVWFDAPIGYISATKEFIPKNGRNIGRIVIPIWFILLEKII